jgi:chorismate mutase
MNGSGSGSGIDLSGEREEIDWIDNEILRLLKRRVGVALRVGEKKKAVGLPLHDPARERFIYEKLRAANREINSELPDAAITAIFREVISACRNAEHPHSVAFLGPSGTNTQEAAVRYFGSAFTPLPCATPIEICHAVARGALTRTQQLQASLQVLRALRPSRQEPITACWPSRTRSTASCRRLWICSPTHLWRSSPKSSCPSTTACSRTPRSGRSRRSIRTSRLWRSAASGSALICPAPPWFL